MRSSRPIPGNPWPQDMVIEIDDDLDSLLELLWVREAYELHPINEDPPPLLTDTPEPATGDATSEQIAEWPELWTSCLAHAGKVRDRDTFERLHTMTIGSDERATLLRQLIGPSWHGRHGRQALEAGYSSWRSSHLEASAAEHQRPLHASPERVSLEALIPAWERGLTKIVTVPCVGDFTRVIGEHALLVTVETRQDAERYAAALALFS